LNCDGDDDMCCTASQVDPSLGGDDATLFLLAVGREGPPLAAKSISLKQLKFPITFEVACCNCFSYFYFLLAVDPIVYTVVVVASEGQRRELSDK